MKILLICNKVPYPPHDGGSLAIATLADSLAKNGNNVSMLCMSTPKHSLTNNYNKYLHKDIALYTVAVDTSIKLHRIVINMLLSKAPYNAMRFISGEFNAALIELLKNNDFQLIQLEGLYLLPYLNTIRKYSDALVSYRSHNIEYMIWKGLSKNTRNKFRSWYFSKLSERLKKMEINYIDKYDVLVPITNEDNEMYMQMGNTKPSLVCPFGISPIKETAKSCSNSGSLFFIASLDWQPNIDGITWFIKNVFPGIHRKYPDIKLNIAGRNAPESFKKLTASTEGIIYHGEVEDSSSFIFNYGIMIAPVFSGSGMRVKIIEAMASGKPVITTTKGAQGITCLDGKEILLAENENDFINKIFFLINDNEKYSFISNNSMKLIKERYNINDITSSLQKFYSNNLQ